MIEKFGKYEQNLTNEQKKEITQFIKYDERVSSELREMAYSAQMETDYFRNLSKFAAACVFAGFCYLPYVNKQRTITRFMISSIPSYHIYYWLHKTADEFQWVKTGYAWQRYQVQNGKHWRAII